MCGGNLSARDKSSGKIAKTKLEVVKRSALYISDVIDFMTQERLR